GGALDVQHGDDLVALEDRQGQLDGVGLGGQHPVARVREGVGDVDGPALLGGQPDDAVLRDLQAGLEPPVVAGGEAQRPVGVPDGHGGVPLAVLGQDPGEDGEGFAALLGQLGERRQQLVSVELAVGVDRYQRRACLLNRADAPFRGILHFRLSRVPYGFGQLTSRRPTMQAMSPRSRSTRAAVTGSEPVTIPYATASDAPTPTHTAYEVPVGSVLIA